MILAVSLQFEDSFKDVNKNKRISTSEEISDMYDKDFKETDNTCVEMSDGERTLMREQFAGKAVLKTESQIQAAAVRARGNAANGVKAQKMLIEGELGQAQKAFSELEKTALSFENDIVKDLNGVERKIVQEVEEVEKEVFSIFKKK